MSSPADLKLSGPLRAHEAEGLGNDRSRDWVCLKVQLRADPRDERGDPDPAS